MKGYEIAYIIVAVFILAIVIGFEAVFPLSSEQTLAFNPNMIGSAILFAFIIIIANVAGKKIVAKLLDADVEHDILRWSRYGMKPGWHLPKPVPLGAVLPIIFTAFSLGLIKFMIILTYETRALKRRAARRFGYYSFTEMTEWHNALVGGGGIIAALLISFIAYWIPGVEGLSKMAAYYAFWNMIPISKSDGSQIFFGSRVFWTTLAIITLIFVAYAILLV